MQRYGMTVPFDDLQLHQQRDRYERLEQAGYTDLWSAEAMGADGITPLTLGAVWTPSMRLGTAILPRLHTRSGAHGPDRRRNRLGGRPAASWRASDRPRTSSSSGGTASRSTNRSSAPATPSRFLKAALSGEKVTESYDTFEVKGFRLGLVPEQPVPILVAALREGMLRMAGRESDGAIINWLSAENAATVSAIVREENPDAEIAARLFVAPTSDTETARNMGKFAAAAYLNVPVYRAFHEWMGRTDALGEHWEQWAAGDRKGALEKIPDDVIDDLIIHGSYDDCPSPRPALHRRGGHLPRARGAAVPRRRRRRSDRRARPGVVT